jgi:hypothetical protein
MRQFFAKIISPLTKKEVVMKKVWPWVITVLLIPVAFVALALAVFLLGAFAYYAEHAINRMTDAIPAWLGAGITLLLIIIVIKASGIPEGIMKFFSKKKE